MNALIILEIRSRDLVSFTDIRRGTLSASLTYLFIIYFFFFFCEKQGTKKSVLWLLMSDTKASVSSEKERGKQCESRQLSSHHRVRLRPPHASCGRVLSTCAPPRLCAACPFSTKLWHRTFLFFQNYLLRFKGFSTCPFTCYNELLMHVCWWNIIFL